MLVGKKICHFNIRRFGQAEYRSSETKSMPGLAQPGEVFETEMDGKPMYTRIADRRYDPPAGMNGTFEIYAVEIEDDGCPPGHREADEDDF
jgi:hypothetical protein